MADKGYQGAADLIRAITPNNRPIKRSQRPVEIVGLNIERQYKHCNVCHAFKTHNYLFFEMICFASWIYRGINFSKGLSTRMSWTGFVIAAWYFSRGTRQSKRTIILCFFFFVFGFCLRKLSFYGRQPWPIEIFEFVEQIIFLDGNHIFLCFGESWNLCF